MARVFAMSAARSAALLGCALGLLASRAPAQVLEPNGARAPKLPSTNGETSIQDYFDAQGETIDALLEASAEPGAFSPLCDFTATVVLAEGPRCVRVGGPTRRRVVGTVLDARQSERQVWELSFAKNNGPGSTVQPVSYNPEALR